jgi:NAD(P)H-dependent flavin oxidoreductase YrpB (nitropropane dioxygenase family)
MFQTRVTEMLGIKYPLVGGTMMWISTPEFVAAISNAGGLGVLASAIYQSPQSFAEAVDRIRDLTDKPFAVNLNLFPMMRPVDNHEVLDVLVEKGVKIVETSGHTAPDDLCTRFKETGMIWIHKCVGVRYALKVQEMGADLVTVVGYENGGATGKLDTGTMVLVPRVVEESRVPVIGGGGIADGRGFLAVLALGAEGLIIGTRLLTTKEAPIHDRLKQALLQASELDTMLILRSLGATHRVWINAAAKRCQDLETSQAGVTEILSVVAGQKAKEMYETGDLEVGVVSCGQGVGLCHDIPTVQELFDRIIREAEEIVTRIGTFSSPKTE